MEYLLFICTDEPFTPDEDMAQTTTAWVDDVDGRGIRKAGDRLRPATDATTVRVRDDEVLISDGPFAETKEQMGGYFFLDCPTLDDAIALAKLMPGAQSNCVEIRALELGHP